MKYAGYYIYTQPSHSSHFRKDNGPQRMPLCSFLLFFCIPLSCFAFSQMPKISGFHPPWQHSTPQGNTSELSVLHTHHHLLRNCPVLSPTHPSTDKQPHHMCQSSVGNGKACSQSNSCHSRFSHW